MGEERRGDGLLRETKECKGWERRKGNEKKSKEVMHRKREVRKEIWKVKVQKERK